MSLCVVGKRGKGMLLKALQRFGSRWAGVWVHGFLGMVVEINVIGCESSLVLALSVCDMEKAVILSAYPSITAAALRSLFITAAAMSPSSSMPST